MFALAVGLTLAAAPAGAQDPSGPVRLEDFQTDSPATQPATQPAQPPAPRNAPLSTHIEPAPPAAVKPTAPAAATQPAPPVPASQPASRPAAARPPRTATQPTQPEALTAGGQDDFEFPKAEPIRRPRRPVRFRQNEDAEVPVIPPITGGQSGPSPARRPLPDDGRHLLGRKARLRFDRASKWWIAEFLPEPGKQRELDRRLLPCRLLTSCVNIARDEPDRVFRLSGLNTTDAKNAYLLLRRVEVLAIEPDQPAPAVASAEPTDTQPATPDTQPVIDPSELRGDATEMLMAEMMEDQRGRAVTVAPTPTRSRDENVDSVAPAGFLPEPGERTAVVDRVVRIVYDADTQWFEARFIGDNTLRDPPLRLLPSQKLLNALRMKYRPGKRHAKFRITGEVTFYQGRRYLLLQKIHYERDMNQL